MKKVKLLLTLLLVAVGVNTTLAATGDKITNAANLNPNKSYYLKTATPSGQNERGYLDAAFADQQHATTITSTSNAGKFVFIPRADGTFYIYNVGQSKFISAAYTTTDANGQSISTVDIPDGTFRLSRYLVGIH